MLKKNVSAGGGGIEVNTKKVVATAVATKERVFNFFQVLTRGPVPATKSQELFADGLVRVFWGALVATILLVCATSTLAVAILVVGIIAGILIGQGIGAAETAEIMEKTEVRR